MSPVPFSRPGAQAVPPANAPLGTTAVSVSGSVFQEQPAAVSVPRQAFPEAGATGLPIIGAVPGMGASAEVPARPMRPSTAVAVDLHEAAEMLHVSAQTVRREIDRGLLRALRIGRVWRIRVSEIESYLERMEDRSKRNLRF